MIKKNTNKIAISALVVSCNEGHLLEECLKSLFFCDEIFGINLESTDNTEELFKKYATSYENMIRVPLVEEIHPIVIPLLKNDWIILIDPDERILEPLKIDIINSIQNAPQDASTYRVPMINFFNNKKLKGTVYGGIKYARLLYKRSAINISTDVHIGIQMKEGFDRYKIQFKGENYDKHLWCSNWKQLFEKHKRYLKGEGKAQYNMGKRYSLSYHIKESIITFYYSFKTKKGYLDGLTGLYLSFIAARYEYLKWIKLKEYEKSIKKS